MSNEATRRSSFALLLYAIASCLCGLILPRIILRYQPQPTDKLSRNSGKFRPTLRRIWVASHLFYGACMLSTPFISTIRSATVLICLIGFPWAITIWIPYALIGIELSRSRSATQHDDLHQGDAGAVLGVHNAAIALPQILVTLSASALFYALGADGLRWIIASGGVAALAAAWMCMGVREPDA